MVFDERGLTRGVLLSGERGLTIGEILLYYQHLFFYVGKLLLVLSFYISEFFYFIFQEKNISMFQFPLEKRNNFNLKFQRIKYYLEKCSS